MSIEREWYERMMGPAPWWQRVARLFVFPALSRQEMPSKAPRGGPIETPPGEVWVPLPIMQSARMLDNLHPAFAEPIVGYMSKAGYDLMRRPGWWTTVYQSRDELTPRGGIVEVEVRLRRVVES